jgi:hypothetical protein
MTRIIIGMPDVSRWFLFTFAPPDTKVLITMCLMTGLSFMAGFIVGIKVSKKANLKAQDRN